MKAKKRLWWMLVQVLRAEKTDDKNVGARAALYRKLDGDAWLPVEGDSGAAEEEHDLSKEEVRAGLDVLQAILERGEQPGSIAFQLDDMRQLLKDELRAG